MSQPDRNSARKVVVFDKKKRYVGIWSSVSCAASMRGINKKLIHYNCTGKSVIVGEYFFRFYVEELNLSLDDLSELTVEQYDKLCGVERVYEKRRKVVRGRTAE